MSSRLPTFESGEISFASVCFPAVSVAHWEQLQQEKEDQEHRFEAELQGLRAQQRSELGALEERLKAQHAEETESLQGHQRAELEELQFRHQEQVQHAETDSNVLTCSGFY